MKAMASSQAGMWFRYVELVLVGANGGHYNDDYTLDDDNEAAEKEKALTDMDNRCVIADAENVDDEIAATAQEDQGGQNHGGDHRHRRRLVGGAKAKVAVVQVKRRKGRILILNFLKLIISLGDAGVRNIIEFQKTR
ncbi:hypothetical protein ABZP36_014212 [Zizania latifolia]